MNGRFQLNLILIAVLFTVSALAEDSSGSKVDNSQLYWSFDKDFQGWERTGSVPPWHTMESAIQWYDQWGGAQGVIVIDACESTPNGYQEVHAEGGIKKDVTLPPDAEKITFNVVRVDHDGGVRFLLSDSEGQHILGEEELSGAMIKQLSYDVSAWRDKKVTLEVQTFGAGTDDSKCIGSSHGCGSCCYEYTGIDWIKITTSQSEISESSNDNLIFSYYTVSGRKLTTENINIGNKNRYVVISLPLEYTNIKNQNDDIWRIAINNGDSSDISHDYTVDRREDAQSFFSTESGRKYFHLLYIDQDKNTGLQDKWYFYEISREPKISSITWVNPKEPDTIFGIRNNYILNAIEYGYSDYSLSYDSDMGKQPIVPQQMVALDAMKANILKDAKIAQQLQGVMLDEPHGTILDIITGAVLSQDTSK